MPNFYEQMPSLSEFPDVVDRSHYHRVPSDWWVVVSDVKGSTKAIEEGRYREVNTVGAATIAAVSNAMGDVSFPFSFGGDGATALIPSEDREAVASSLSALRKISFRQFRLRLRIGMVSIKDLEERGKPVWLAKFGPNHRFPLATFQGGGIQLAEDLVKSEEHLYEVRVFDNEDTDLTQLSCRWKPLQSQKGVVVTLLVSAQTEVPRDTYREVLTEIDEILGALESANPVNPESLKYESLREMLTRDRKYQNGWWRRIPRLIQTLFASLAFGWSLFRFIAPLGSYVKSIPQHTDFRKFDDMLRMVVDCTPEQSAALEEGLQARHERGEIYYGLHRSDTALMTCFLHSLKDGEHIHFIDGGDGGYAMAAKQLKAQMKAEGLAVAFDTGEFAT